MKEGGRGGSLGRSGQRTQTGLAVAQVALCLALLVGANLMIRSFLSLQQADIGFDDAPLLTLRATWPATRSTTTGRARNFFDRAVDAVARAPGRDAASRRRPAFPATTAGRGVRVVTDERLAAGERDRRAGDHRCTAGLLRALGLRPRCTAARSPTAESLDPEARVTVVNARLARRLWPDGSAVGRRIGTAGGAT